MEVKVKIKDPILRSYLSGLFEKRDGGYAVTMDTFTGSVICALTSVIDYPMKQADDETTVLFYLPKSRYNDSFRNRYLYVYPEAEAKINAVLRREFDTNFTAFVTESRMQGFKLQDIIAIFIVENQMDIFDGDIETLKKRYYRKEVEILKGFHKKMQLRAYAATKKAKDIMMKNIIF